MYLSKSLRYNCLQIDTSARLNADLSEFQVAQKASKWQTVMYVLKACFNRRYNTLPRVITIIIINTSTESRIHNNAMMKKSQWIQKIISGWPFNSFSLNVQKMERGKFASFCTWSDDCSFHFIPIFLSICHSLVGTQKQGERWIWKSLGAHASRLSLFCIHSIFSTVFGVSN